MGRRSLLGNAIATARKAREHLHGVRDRVRDRVRVRVRVRVKARVWVRVRGRVSGWG